MNVLPPPWVQSYLDRLRIPAPKPPTLDFLVRLQRAHVAYVPWETVDIFAGRPEPIDETTSVGLVVGHRSGYGFHLNGAFAVLLAELGFRVRRHQGGVQRRGGPPVVDGPHLGLTVELPEGVFVVDAGLGDMPRDPLPLVLGTYPQGGLTHRPEASAAGGWRLVHDPKGGYEAVDFAPGVVSNLGVFEAAHKRLSTDPASPWVRRLVVKNRDDDGVNALQGLTLIRTDEDGTRSQVLEGENAWFQALSDLFAEHLVTYDHRARAALWAKVVRQHEAWLAGGRP